MSSADSLVYAGISQVSHAAGQTCLSTMINLEPAKALGLNVSHTLIGFADYLFE
jgi:hypothetical protein